MLYTPRLAKVLIRNYAVYYLITVIRPSLYDLSILKVMTEIEYLVGFLVFLKRVSSLTIFTFMQAVRTWT